MAKRVLVTGCTRGIGRALLEFFGKEHLVAGCGRSTNELEELKQKLPKAVLKQLDLSNSQAVEDWMKELKENWQQIDLLVANAGVLPQPAKLWETRPEDWRTVYESNVLCTAELLRNAVPLLGEGSVVVIMSSRYGRTVAPGMACYSAAKWATEALAKTMALELRQTVAVVSLDPGVVNTEMLRQSCSSEDEFDWCSQQRTPAEFAAATGPFMLSLTLADTGKNLTAPGSPESYFKIGMPYKDRPAWASGFSSFWSEQHRCNEPKRYFISGVMLGSAQKLEKAEEKRSAKVTSRI